MNRLMLMSGSRWLALSLLVLVMLVVGGLLVVPLVDKAVALSEEKDDLIFRLERYKRMVDRKAAVMESTAKIKTDYDNLGYFSSRGTEALASADLQNFVKTVIAEAGGQLTSTQVLPSKNEGDFWLIAVKVRMNGDVETLRSVLYRIETAIPLYAIDEIDIRPVRGRRNPLTRMIEPSNKLNVSFQISSFMNKNPQ
ncbi:MAG: hypothetical protein Kow0065_12130 [Methylomicrobium sp.]